ncbi:MAG: hypothetical protein AAGE01_20865 [Pseudomonadota bacterium]
MFIKLLRALHGRLLAAMVVTACLPAHGAFIYLPGSLQGTDTDTGALGLATERIQLVVDDARLGGMPAGSLVTGLALRVAPGAASSLTAQTITRYEIRLSQSTNPPGFLSTTFADNRGADEVVVRSGSLFLPETAPGEFVEIDFEAPYVFSGGPLLIELAHDGFPAGGVSAQARFGEAGVQSAFGTGFDATTANLGTFNDHVVVRIRFEAPPAPDGVYRLRTEASLSFWHEDGFGDRLVSTRFQTDDAFSRFVLEDRGDGLVGLISRGSGGRLRVDPDDQLLSTREDIDDAFASFLLAPEGNQVYRIFNDGNGRFLHEDGGNDQFLSTRFQPDDGFTRFGVFREAPERMLGPGGAEYTQPPEFLPGPRDQVFSGNGQVLAYITASSNVLGGDDNERVRVVTYDFATGEAEVIDVTPTGAPSNQGANAVAISDDGRYVAFSSQSDNLVDGVDVPPNPEFGDADIFLRDRLLQTTTRISREGIPGAGTRGTPRLSGDGQVVAYASSEIDGTRVDIYLYDRTEDRYELVTRAFDGGDADGDSLSAIALSSDGRFLLFQSAAENLVENDDNGRADAFLFDRSTGMLERIDVSPFAKGDEPAITTLALSSDGDRVLLTTDAALDPLDVNEVRDHYLLERSTQTLTLVTVAADGGPADGSSFGGRLSADGRYASFFSFATNITPGDENGVGDIFIRDLEAGVTVLFSTRFDGNPIPSGAVFEALAGDASRIAFQSSDAGVVDGDTNDVTDLFVMPVIYPDRGLQPVIEFDRDVLEVLEGDDPDVFYQIRVRRFGNEAPGAGVELSFGAPFAEATFASFDILEVIDIIAPGQGNDIVDGDREFEIELVFPRNARIGGRSTLTVRIIDDDALPEEVFKNGFEGDG